MVRLNFHRRQGFAVALAAVIVPFPEFRRAYVLHKVGLIPLKPKFLPALGRVTNEASGDSRHPEKFLWRRDDLGMQDARLAVLLGSLAA